jgi:hypothetical protein
MAVWPGGAVWRCGPAVRSGGAARCSGRPAAVDWMLVIVVVVAAEQQKIDKLYLILTYFLSCTVCQ